MFRDSPKMQQFSFFRFFKGSFTHDVSTFQMSYKFVSSNKFEVQVEPASLSAAQVRYRQREIVKGLGHLAEGCGARRPGVACRHSQIASVGKISAKCCSFSAVSAPIFARKYAFDSIFQNLPDSQAEVFEIW